VKGYAAHERARSTLSWPRGISEPEGPAAKGESEGLLTGALAAVVALAERILNCGAVESFTQLQNTLHEIEDSGAECPAVLQRRWFGDFNTNDRGLFPSNIVAGMGHFRKREFFR